MKKGSYNFFSYMYTCKITRCRPLMVSVWFSSNALVSTNVVTLHRAQLVPGWVTILGRVNQNQAPRSTEPEPSLCG